MRPTPKTSLSFLLAAILGHVLAAQSSRPDAGALLQAAHRKTGKPMTLPLRLTGTVQAAWVSSQRTTPFAKGSFTEMLGGDGKRLLRVQLPSIGTFEWGSDGKQTWRVEPERGAVFRTGSNAKLDRLLSCLLHGQVDWRKYYQKARMLRHRQHNGRKQTKLEMQRASGKDIWYLDHGTGLPADAILHGGQTGNAETVYLSLGKWQPHQGHLLPRRRVLREAHLQLAMHTVKVDAKVKATDFRMRERDRAQATKSRKAPDAKSTPVIRVSKLPKQHAVVIRVKVKPSEISLAFAKILPEVAGYLARQGVATIGAPFSRYHSFSPTNVDLEAGFVVAKKTAVKGRMKAVVMPAGRAAITWHIGPYHELSRTQERIRRWIGQQGLRPAGPSREVYWTDPGLERNPKKWRTEVIVPVR